MPVRRHCWQIIVAAFPCVDAPCLVIIQVSIGSRAQWLSTVLEELSCNLRDEFDAKPEVSRAWYSVSGNRATFISFYSVALKQSGGSLGVRV